MTSTSNVQSQDTQVKKKPGGHHGGGCDPAVQQQIQDLQARAMTAGVAIGSPPKGSPEEVQAWLQSAENQVAQAETEKRQRQNTGLAGFAPITGNTLGIG